MAKSTVSVGFSGLLFLLFLGLKLGHVISWSWWWIFSPLWLPLALVLIIFLFVIIFFHRVSRKKVWRKIYD